MYIAPIASLGKESKGQVEGMEKTDMDEEKLNEEIGQHIDSFANLA